MKNTSKAAKDTAQEVLSFTLEKRKSSVFHHYLSRQRRQGKLVWNYGMLMIKMETNLILLSKTYCMRKAGIRRRFYNYLCVTDCPKDSIRLQQGETIAYQWVSREEFIAYMDSGDCMDIQKVRLKEFVDSIR